jgi:hypothetical protein
MPNNEPVGATYAILEGGAAIQCLRCNATSHHPKDVSERYCGNCHAFHADRELEARLEFEAKEKR